MTYRRRPSGLLSPEEGLSIPRPEIKGLREWMDAASIGTLVGAKPRYSDKVISVAPTQLKGYWPLWQPAANPAVAERSSAGLSGIQDIDNVVLGKKKLYLAGSGMYANIYTAGLAAAFDGAEGGVVIRSKVSAAAVWSDGVTRRAFSIGDALGANQISMRTEGATPNSFWWRRWAGGAVKGISNLAISDTDWMTMGMTWSEAADQLIAYYNGAQQGATQTGLGTFVGPPDSSRCVIGANDTTPTNVWSGWLGDLILVMGVVPSPAQMASLHTFLATGGLAEADLDAAFGSGNWLWWPLEDIDVEDLSGQSNHGRSIGGGWGATGIGDGRTARSQYGSGDYINIWSPDLRDSFNPSEGGLLAWIQPAATSVWTDGAVRALVWLRADANNYLGLYKRGGAADDIIEAIYNGAGTVDAVDTAAQTGTAWRCLLMTWSVASDQLRLFINGTLLGTATTLGTWSGDLSITNTLIGASAAPAAQVWNGQIAHVAVWAGIGVPAILQANATVLATVPP